jgi:hypothetical protein
MAKLTSLAMKMGSKGSRPFMTMAAQLAGLQTPRKKPPDGVKSFEL